MTPHPNAEYLRAMADGKRVMVTFSDGDCIPLDGCSSTVWLSLLHPQAVPQARFWTFHIEEQTP